MRSEIMIGLRNLLKRPGLTGAAVLALGLGIGATSSTISVVRAVLFRSLPYFEPEKLVWLEGVKVVDGTPQEWPLSHLDIADWRRENRVFSDIAAFSSARSFNLLSGGVPEHIKGEMVSASYFNLLGVNPVIGRVFHEEEDTYPGPRRLVMISHSLWQRRFARQSSAVGSTLLINGGGFQIVGVLPPGFQGLSDEADIWLPLSMAGDMLAPRYLEWRRFRWLSAVGRLRPEVALEQAQQAMDRITTTLAEQHPDTNKDIGVRGKLLPEAWFGDLRPVLLTLFGAGAFVLMIGCLNVGNLLLARAMERQHEIALRTALGARRIHLVQQVFVESMLLAALGSLVGLLLAYWGSGALIAISGLHFRSFVRISVLDPAVVGITFVIALCSACAYSLIPLWLILRQTPGMSLGDVGKGTPGPARQRLRNALVVLEIAITLTLLVGSGVLIENLQNLLRTDLGFQPDNLITMRLNLYGDKYAEDQKKRILVRQLLEHLEQSARLEGVAMSSPTIPTDEWAGASYVIEDRRGTDVEPAFLVFDYVSPGYFRTLGIPLLAGRDFAAQDTERTGQVAIVSAAAAKHYWPGQSPIGKRLQLVTPTGDAPWTTIVGVVGDVKYSGFDPDEIQKPKIYFTLLQIPPSNPPLLNLILRGQVANAKTEVGKALGAVAPDLPPFDVASIQDRLQRQMTRSRFVVLLMTVFAGMAFLLAMIGVYGVLSYSVGQRRREIGIRMALGANRGGAQGLVIKQAMQLALAGILCGVFSAFALSRFMQRILALQIRASDLAVLGVSLPLLFLAVLVASYIPSRRAAKIEPMRAIRE